MILEYPLIISSRLLPAVKVADLTISIEPLDAHRWRAFFDFDDGREYTDETLRSGQGRPGRDAREMLGTLLVFLEACGEAAHYSEGTRRHVENADLFEKPLATWASEHTDDLTMTRLEIEEPKTEE